MANRGKNALRRAAKDESTDKKPTAPTKKTEKSPCNNYKDVVEQRYQEILGQRGRSNAIKIQKEAVTKYKKRWGHDQQPTGGDLPEHEKLRTRFWRVKNGTSIPKCHSCFVGQSEMPKGDHIATGTEESDTLPCGCLFKTAIIEEYLAVKGYIQYTKGADIEEPKEKKHIKMGRNELECFANFMWDFFDLHDDLDNLFNKDSQKALLQNQSGTVALDSEEL